ncbi:MAG: glycosyltransferase family 2 protein [Bacteroidota bacterium]
MSPGDLLAVAVVCLYAAGAVWLTALGLHAALLTVLRAVCPPRSLPAADVESWPTVVVQLPVYNEPAALVARALDAALALDARGLVQIQLLDDSSPAAQRTNAALCAERAGRRYPIRHLPRAQRRGFKAGALADGLRQTDAPLAAVFDVDFRPPADLLHRLVPPLLADDQLAFVQGRWTHPEAPDTWLARAQEAVLDVHFVIDQQGRDRAGLPVLFNGSGGVWRVAAIDDAGGWTADTLAEDLDLTVRAWAKGWRARFDADAEVPADLPATVSAWRRQQARWVKGLAEVGVLHLGRLWRSGLAVRHKAAFTAHLALAWSLPASLVVVVLHPLVTLAASTGAVPGNALAVLGVGYAALIGIITAHVVALRAIHPESWKARLVRIPAALVFPVGLLVPGIRSVVEAVRRHATPFVRTPKGGASGGEAGRAEVALAVYSVVGALAVIWVGAWGSAVFQSLVALATVGAAIAVRRRTHVPRTVPSDAPAQVAA